MSISNTDWSNKSGTAQRSCPCGTWKNHWINFSKQKWPSQCSVFNCTNPATLGAHVYHPDASGERIVPMCSICNGKSGKFNLKGSTSIPSANKSLTCSK